VPRDRPSRGDPGSGYAGRSWRNDWHAAECYHWDGHYYYGSGYYYSPFGDGFGYDRAREATHYIYAPAPSSGPDRLPIFFPPSPPPLDTPSPVPPVGEPALPAPRELAAYITDPFYAPLSTRLAEGNLTDALRRRLNAYQETKVQLQMQLQGKLDGLSSEDAAVQESALAAFAREQTPRILALEASAENLRVDLLRAGLVGLFSGTGDWNEHRTWRLGAGQLAREGDESAMARYRVARAAVFYQDGLSTAQRRLLREVAMELQVQAFKPAGAVSSADALVFFSPDTARVQLPSHLPPAIADQISSYQQEKTALKSQLRDTLFQQDRATRSVRAHAMKQLAIAQAPRLAALDQAADKIRRELSAHPSRAAAPPLIAFPPELARRVTTYQKGRALLQEAIRTKLDEISRILPPSQFNVIQHPNPTGGSVLTVETRPTAGSIDRRRLVQDAIIAFNVQHRESAAALARESVAIHAAVAEFAVSHPEKAQGKSAEVLLQEYGRISMQTKTRPLHAEYHAAVFQPGLSSEQRRLLFDTALQKLALPLPGGELQP
jgi:hypothetical protein